LTVFGITVIATRVVLSILGDRLPQRLAVGGALVTLALGLIVLAVAASFAVAAAGAALMGVGFAPLFPALTRWSARNLGPSGQLGAGLSIFGSFTTVGYAIGSLSTGVVIDWYGSRPAFLGMGLAQLAVGVGLLAWGARRRPHPTTE
jgi:predicted MFS family arabinose efflux permease